MVRIRMISQLYDHPIDGDSMIVEKLKVDLANRFEFPAACIKLIQKIVFINDKSTTKTVHFY